MLAEEKKTKTATGSALYNLLADMAQEPRKFDKYRNNLESLLEDYELTDEQKALIRQGGEEAYIQLLRSERKKQFGDFCV